MMGMLMFTSAKGLLHLACRDMNLYDNARGARITDALLNYETVKVFGNEEYERSALDSCIAKYQDVEYKLMASLNGLNVLQSVIIFSGLIAGLMVCVKVSSVLNPELSPSFPQEPECFQRSPLRQIVLQDTLSCKTHCPLRHIAGLMVVMKKCSASSLYGLRNALNVIQYPLSSSGVICVYRVWLMVA